MRIHESVFWGIILFLGGIFLATVMPMQNVVIATCICGVMFGVIGWSGKNKKLKQVAVLSIFTIIGGLYGVGYNQIQKEKTQGLIGKKIASEGIVIDVRQSEKVQRLQILLPNEARIAVTARAYPEIAYGDRISVRGRVARPSKENARYLIKDAVVATMDFPELEIKQRGAGNPIKQKLVAARQRVVAIYRQTLAADEAALLAGITIGERASFDDAFVEQMKRSGTTHLVALSGYNISVIATILLSFAAFFCKGIMRSVFAFIGIALFVIMAGAEASAVRAAIMGSIVLLAQYLGRAHSMRNAIAVSALGMVLWNPNVLRHDLGFQLSFAALIGIVYVKPHMDAVIKRGKEGVLDWRENLSGTAAAQLAVFPIIMQQIGSFSISALLSNILILAFIPTTMAIGGIIAIAGFISVKLAAIPAMVASIVLQYEIGIIRIFGAHAGLVMGMSVYGVVAYYMIGAWLVLRMQKKKETI